MAASMKADTDRRRSAASRNTTRNIGTYTNSRYLSRHRPAAGQLSTDHVTPASNNPNNVSDHSATVFARMTAHFARHAPEQTQQAMNRPVVISENDVDKGMLKPVSTARKRVASSSGVPVANHAKRSV